MTDRGTHDQTSDQLPAVGFTAMADGTAQDYQLLARFEDAELARVPDRILGWLRDMDDHSGYQVTRLEHSLQAATRAFHAGEDEETVVCVLVHDIGDMLAPANHSEVAAAVVRPYVSERNYWVLKHHGVFQGVYWFHHVGADPNIRERWADHPWYQDCVDFCANYDQSSFDPEYPTKPLEFFEPMLRRTFAPRPRHSPRPGVTRRTDGRNAPRACRRRFPRPAVALVITAVQLRQRPVERTHQRNL